MPIVRIHNRPENKYGNYFLASEAPGDDGESRTNVKVVSVPQTGGRRKDFTQGYDEVIDDQEPIDDVTPDTPTPADDYSAGNDATTNTQDDFTADVPDDTSGTTDYSDTGDTADMGGEGTPVDDGTNNADVAVDDTAGDDTTDFTAGSDDVGVEGDSAADGTAPPADNQATQQTTGAGTDQDSTRKFKLYNQFIALYRSLENYISKLEKIVRDDESSNKVIIYCTNRFRELRDILYDYIIIKFVQNNYIQNLLFYEKLIATTQLTLKILRNINKNEKYNK